MFKEIESFENNLVNSISNDFVTQFDRIVIDGLKLKGYVFKDRIELSAFIESNCFATEKDNMVTYYVNNVPFLLHKRLNNINPITNIEGTITITVDFGEYTYL